jgi:tetratricopeptide (TPR) repeat protein
VRGTLLNRWLKARWFIFLGRRRLRSHRFQLALGSLRNAAEHEPGNLHTAIEIAWCLYKLKDYQAAIDKYESALQRRPDYASAHACLGLALAEVQRTQEAVEAVRRGLRINPKLKDRAYFEACLGKWLEDLGRYEEAIGPLQNAIKSNPMEAGTHYSLGYAYGQQDRDHPSIHRIARKS